jgi:precorrin-6A/cobalt-precorrin-6A reductase
MRDDPCLLILGGTGDAARLAHACAAKFTHLRTLSSLAGRTRSPTPLPGEVHVGGFGGAQGLTNFMRRNAVDLVIDATHPFAAQISRHAALACTTLEIPCLQLLRRAWSAASGDRWIDASDMADAARQLTANFAADDVRVFLSTGRQQLAAFAHFASTWFLLRTVDPLDSPLPLAHCETLVGRGPFTVDEERTLLEQHRIDVLVSKNSGGQATYAKILAARALSLPVIMLQRPQAPPGLAVHDIAQAIEWLQSSL